MAGFPNVNAKPETWSGPVAADQKQNIPTPPLADLKQNIIEYVRFFHSISRVIFRGNTDISCGADKVYSIKN